MTDASITLGIDGRPAEQGAKVVKEALGSVKKEAGATVAAVDKNTSAFDKLKQSSFGLRGAFAGLAAAMSVDRLIRYSDTWKQLEGRLTIATRGITTVATAQRDLYQVSQLSRTSLEANAQLYTKLAINAGQLGLKHKDLIVITQAVGQSLKVSGAASSESSAAIRQLGQALASGVLRGDEFNSIMENAPRLQKAITTELKVTSGELRAMAEAGTLSSQKIANAIKSQAAAIAEDAAKIPLTVSDAMTKVNNAFLQFIGQSAAISGATSGIALSLSLLADNFDAVANGITAIAIALGANYVGALLTAQGATMTFAGVVAGAGKVMATAFPVAAVAAAVYLLLNYFDEIKAGIAVVGTYVATGFVAMGEYVAGFGAGMIRALGAAFSEAKRIAATFAKDLKRLVTDPMSFVEKGFSSADFSGAGGRISDAFASEWNKAGAAARSYGKEFKGILDDTVEGYRQKKINQESLTNEVEKYEAATNKALEGMNKADAAVKKTGKSHKDAAKAALEHKDAVAEIADKGEEVAQIFKDVATGIQQSFGQAFRDLIDGKNGLKGFASSLKNVFKTMLANLATIAIAQPIIIPIVQSIGGALGLSSDAIGQVTGQLGGGSAGGGIGSLASLGSSALNLLSGGTSQTLAGGFDAVGRMFGIGSRLSLPGGVAGSTTIGGLSQYSSLTNGSFGGSLGGAAGGFIGNFGANALLGNRGMAADIGGTLGGIAGSFIPVPILGPMIGSFIGNAIGGLFSKKPSSGLQSGSFDLASGSFLERGGLTGKKFNQGNFDAVTGLGAVVSTIASVFGAKGGLQLASGNRNGLEYAMTDDKSIFNADSDLRKSFKSANELVKSLTEDFAKQAGEGLNKSLATALKNIDYGKTQEDLTKALEDLVFAAGFDKLGEESTPITQTAQRLEEINKAFDVMAETTKRLGLEEAKIEALRKKSIDTLRATTNQASFASLYEMTDPQGFARSAEQSRFAAQLREVQAVNGNLEAVYTLHRLNMLKIDQQYSNEEIQNRVQALQSQAQAADALVESYGRIAETLKNAAQGMRLGSLSTLSPLAKYQESGSLFEMTLQKALAGNADAMEQLPSLGQQFLELSQSYNSSNEIFARDFDAVQKGLEETRAVAIAQVDTQKSIAAAAWKNVEVAQKGFDALQQAIAALGGFGKVGGVDPFTGAAANAAGRSLSEVTSNGLTVGAIESAGRALLGGYSGSSGNGEINKMLAERGLNGAFSATLKSMGARGYAIGGTPYNAPFIVGENQPEIVADRRSAMVIPFQQNAAILRELEGMRRELRVQNRTLSDGMTQQIAATQEVGQNTARLADDTAIQKRKRV